MPETDMTFSKKLTARPPPEDEIQDLPFDWHEWESCLVDEDLNDAQKRELLETLWSLIMSFIDLGLEFEPVFNIKSVGSTHAFESAEEKPSGFTEIVLSSEPYLTHNSTLTYTDEHSSH